MFREAEAAAAVVRLQRERIADPVARLARRLREAQPRAVLTLARGSSDHAATFARYLIETRAGVLTSSISPSVGSIYERMPELSGTVALAISQSGRSPDLLAAAEQACARGAILIALVNEEQSPLAQLAEVVIPLCAGIERSVAATKSYIASLSAILHLLAGWTGDPAIAQSLVSLPENIDRAWSLDWSAALSELSAIQAMYVVGRGHALAIAQEAALKLKETCRIQAEAFSAAEVRHGPMAMVGAGFPVFVFGQGDESLESVSTLSADFAGRGGRVISAGVPRAPGMKLPVVAADPLVAPILQIASFYRMANSLALARGLDPDHPHHLSKVTETL